MDLQCPHGYQTDVKEAISYFYDNPFTTMYIKDVFEQETLHLHCFLCIIESLYYLLSSCCYTIISPCYPLSSCRYTIKLLISVWAVRCTTPRPGAWSWWPRGRTRAPTGSETGPASTSCTALARHRWWRRSGPTPATHSCCLDRLVHFTML